MQPTVASTVFQQTEPIGPAEFLNGYNILPLPVPNQLEAQEKSASVVLPTKPLLENAIKVITKDDLSWASVYKPSDTFKNALLRH